MVKLNMALIGLTVTNTNGPVVELLLKTIGSKIMNKVMNYKITHNNEEDINDIVFEALEHIKQHLDDCVVIDSIQELNFLFDEVKALLETDKEAFKQLMVSSGLQAKYLEKEARLLSEGKVFARGVLLRPACDSLVSKLMTNS